MRNRLGLIGAILVGCTATSPHATVGVDLSALTASDDGVGFNRDEIGTVRLVVTCGNGAATTLDGSRGDDDVFTFAHAPTCDQAAMDLTITRKTEAGEITALIGEAEAQIVSPRVNVVFATRRFGELAVDVGAGSETCLVTAFDATPHRHEAEPVTVTAAPTSPSIALPAGQYTIACGEHTPWLATVEFAERVTTKLAEETKQPSNDASLAALTVVPGVLAPAFGADVLSYGVGIVAGATGTEVHAKTTHPAATVTIGAATATADLTTTVTWSDLPSAFTVRVVAEDGTTTRDYVVNVTAQSSDSTLQALTVTPGVLAPAFTPSIPSYTVDLPESASTLDVTALPASPKSSVAIQGATATQQTVPLSPGNNAIAIIVTAEDTTSRQYTINARRGLLSALTASTGVIGPTFAPIVRRYDVKVGTSVPFSVTATPVSSNIGISFNGVFATTGPATSGINTPPPGRTPNFYVVTAKTPGGLSEDYWVSATSGTSTRDGLFALAPSGSTNMRAYAWGPTGSLQAPTSIGATISKNPLSLAIDGRRGSRVLVGETQAGMETLHPYLVTPGTADVSAATTTILTPMKELAFNPAGDRVFYFGPASAVLQSCAFTISSSLVGACATPDTLPSGVITASAPEPSGRWLYVASSGAAGKIYRYDLSSGLARQSDTVSIPSVYQLLVHPDGAALYAVNSPNQVTTFAIDRATGVLSTPVVTTFSSDVTHVALQGDWGVAALSASTDMAALKLTPDGRIGSVITSTLAITGVEWVELHSNGTNIAALDGSAIRTFALNPTTGAITATGVLVLPATGTFRLTAAPMY